MRKHRPMGKITRGRTAEACLARLFDGWVPAWPQSEWVREAPNAKSFAWRREPMSTEEHRLLGEYR